MLETGDFHDRMTLKCAAGGLGTATHLPPPETDYGHYCSSTVMDAHAGFKTERRGEGHLSRYIAARASEVCHDPIQNGTWWSSLLVLQSQRLVTSGRLCGMYLVVECMITQGTNVDSHRSPARRDPHPPFKLHSLDPKAYGLRQRDRAQGERFSSRF